MKQYLVKGTAHMEFAVALKAPNADEALDQLEEFGPADFARALECSLEIQPEVVEEIQIQ